jgi:hypothetical protein
LSLSAELRKQRSTLTNKGTLFEGTGIHYPSPGVVEVDGQLQGAGFDGDLATDNVGTTGWALSATKAAMPELLLRPGSIGNDALTNPVVPLRAHADASNYSIPTSFGTVMSVTVAVPVGFTQALLLSISVMASAINSSAVTGWLYGRALINGAGTAGWSVGSPDTPAGETAVSLDVTSKLVPVTSGGSMLIEGQLSTNGGGTWAANPVNVANMDASILFLR